MPKYEVTQSFSTTVMHRGGNVYLRGAKGETIDLDAEIADLVNADIAGTLRTPKAPKSKARQVTNAPNRKR